MEQLQAKKKTGKKIALIVIPLVALVLIGVLAVTVLLPLMRYNKAVSLFEEEKYEEAYAAFLKMGDYKDSEDYLLRCRYRQALSLVEAGEYEKAYFALLALGDYEDCKKLRQEFEILYDARTASDGSWERYVYDEKGRWTKIEERSADGEETVFEYVYNDYGDIVWFRFDSTGTDPHEEEYRYEYNSEGRAIYEESVIQNEVYTRREYTYDADGNLIKVVCYDREGLSHTEEFSYTADGKQAKYTYVDRMGDRDLWENTYDAEGRVIKNVQSYNGQESVTEHTYGADGKRVSSRYVNYNGDVTNTTYAYNSAGKMIEKVSTSEQGTETLTRAYHENGLMAEEKVHYVGEGGTETEQKTVYNEYELEVEYSEWTKGEDPQKTTYEYENIRVVYNPNQES